MPCMSSLALTLIVFSALMHALWNLLVKRSRDKTVFIWWMFLCSGSMMNLGLPFVGSFPIPSWHVLGLAASGAGCFMLYHLFNGRAYHTGDLSLTYPLSQTSMLWVPLWGVLLLGEKISQPGLAGIALILCGAYCVQLRRLAWQEITRPFHNLRDPGVIAALMAGFIYSIGSVVDKSGVTIYPPFHFTYLLVAFMLLYMTLNILRPRFRGRILAEFRASRHLVFLSGPIMMGSFFTFRYGLKLAPMSYAVPVRQVSLLIGVLIGVFFLGESCGRMRFSAALLILAGVALIRLG